MNGLESEVFWKASKYKALVGTSRVYAVLASYWTKWFLKITYESLSSSRYVQPMAQDSNEWHNTKL